MLRYLLLFGALTLQAKVNIVIETEFGPIEAQLDDKRAPQTVANFLRYVDTRAYDGSRFHRTVRTKPDNQPQSTIKIDVIQASLDPSKDSKPFPPVPLERTNKTGIKHRNGTLSMARTEPDSATNQFFICVGPQPNLDFGGKRNPDGQGFAAFGRVVSGMDIVRRVHESAAAPSDDQSGVTAGNQRLNPPIKIISIRRK